MNNKIKILIVESHTIVALDLQTTLMKAGYDVIACAETGEEAIEKVRELNPDIIVLDYYLIGKINGKITAKQIKKLCKAPLMIYSTYKEMTIITNELSNCFEERNPIQSCTAKLKYNENKKLSI